MHAVINLWWFETSKSWLTDWLFVVFTQGRLQDRKEARRTVRAYMVTNNPSWGNMSAMTLIACQRGDIIAHELCWAVVCKAWKRGYIFQEASYYVAFYWVNSWSKWILHYDTVVKTSGMCVHGSQRPRGPEGHAGYRLPKGHGWRTRPESLSSLCTWIVCILNCAQAYTLVHYLHLLWPSSNIGYVGCSSENRSPKQSYFCTKHGEHVKEILDLNPITTAKSVETCGDVVPDIVTHDTRHQSSDINIINTSLSLYKTSRTHKHSHWHSVTVSHAIIFFNFLFTLS